MNSFSFYNPVKILFGKGLILEIKNHISLSSKVLILYGSGSVLQNGTMDQVKKALAGYDFLEFGGIESNPEFSTLQKATSFALENKRDFLLAVGGGSVFDATKFIAALMEEPLDGEKILYSVGECIQKACPWGGILTLPATGSEMNQGAVISWREKKIKLSVRNPLLFPLFSVLDPTVTFSLPLRQIANGVVDSFVHILEQYLTYPCDNVTTDYLSEALLKTILEVGPKTYHEPHHEGYRSHFMWAATLALNGLLKCGSVQDWATHGIGHQITALTHLDHARTLSALLPSLWKVAFPFKKEKLAQLGERVFGLKGEKEEVAWRTIEEVEKFFQIFQMPITLKEAPECEHLTSSLVLEKLQELNMLSLGERGILDKEKIEKILKMSLRE